MNSPHVPDWQLPPGVTRGLWDYAQSSHIASGYDEFFAEHELFEFDEQVLLRYFSTPGLVADLGCGTGRALIPLVRKGHRGLAIDLSDKMLAVVREKAALEHLAIECHASNLVELDGLASEQADYAICLFSTLGMIRGKSEREKALGHARRILKPGGLFVVHVHNYWFNLFDPTGPLWLVRNLFRSTFVGDVERGDKYFHYRGIHNMYLHVFTRREFVNLLSRSGFELVELIPLATNRQHALAAPWFFGGIRAGGWIAVCRKDDRMMG